MWGCAGRIAGRIYPIELYRDDLGRKVQFSNSIAGDIVATGEGAPPFFYCTEHSEEDEEVCDNAKIGSYLMGIAMLFVVVFHAFCWIYNPVGGFNIGYVGVDMFLFLSGFGLASSFEKNKLSIFYKNRLKRIYPMYSLAVLTTYLFLCQNDWGIDDLLYNLSSLGFYTKGGTQRYDWYLES